ncbi:glycoside hydrolase family 68 protein [Salipaludibacillus agaradhaerens]|uniref:Glycoside hydrolase family 68 protein n=1 Tax=Salipaludibacillus agaradhaerens TaxID=76935 RepID=A0A9Q4B387_SALAG|nr:glycoside hydrolase family 68 protein [Salipaludibacillus agaradhaerens]MCR6097522.1 glycoside hydrolase family 68 protein [Salipaludibacillus agaradhaerens]MCR6112994.1 glycoside hydrolase family 68 protein [Salipaludibacillus agaradhaerens]
MLARKSFLKKAKVLTLSILAITLSVPGMNSVEAEDTDSPVNWTREQVDQIELDDSNTIPYTNIKELEKMTPDYHIWDSWPLTDRNGNVTEVNGWKVLFTLSAPSDVLPGKVHDIAKIQYFVSRDGKDWELGGELFPEEDSLGSREWAGSAMMDEDEGKIYAFYTATGRKGEENLTYEQRLAMSVGDVVADKNGVHFENWDEHSIILEPDGEDYQSYEQAMENGYSGYAFRDPQWFKDTKTGKEYILFEGNSGGRVSERTCENEDVPEGSEHFNGNIGIAEVVDGDFSDLKVHSPLLEANCVNDELERPHIIVKDDKYYLFTDTHINKYAPGIEGPEGLYGFVSDTLFGGYEPLNGSGLVLANPPENPYQAYSWLVLPDLKVIAFAQFGDLNGMDINEIGHKDPEFQFEHWGGTMAPTLEIGIDGDRTEFKKELPQGWIK